MRLHVAVTHTNLAQFTSMRFFTSTGHEILTVILELFVLNNVIIIILYKIIYNIYLFNIYQVRLHVAVTHTSQARSTSMKSSTLMWTRCSGLYLLTQNSTAVLSRLGKLMVSTVSNIHSHTF